MEGTAMTKSTLGRSGKSKLRLLFGASVSGAMLTTVLVAAPAGAQTAPLCEGRPATIVGTNGPDNLVGTNGDDVIVGLGGNDVINSLDGDDIVCGGDGNDLVRAGRGEDRVFGEAGNDVIRGQQSADFIDGGDGDDQLRGQNGADEINGGHGDDTILGGKGRDVIDGQTGHDDIGGGNHDDTVIGGYGDDFLRGGNGADVIDSGGGDDNVRGGIGVDRIDPGFFPGDVINTGAGEDFIFDQLESERRMPPVRVPGPESREDAIRTIEIFLGNADRSKQQVINQLIFANGFSAEDANFAAEAVVLDYDQKAVGFARTLLGNNNLSEQRLFNELHFSAQFTVEESLFAIETIDPDFVAEAVPQVERLVELSAGISRSRLIPFLTDDFAIASGFRPAVAEQAIDRVGVDFGAEAGELAASFLDQGLPCAQVLDFLSQPDFGAFTDAEASQGARSVGC